MTLTAPTAPEREPDTDCAGKHSSAADAFEALRAAAPEGWRVELIEGEIHVVPPANGEHEEMVFEVVGQVRDQRRDLATYTGIGLLLTEGVEPAKVAPDLVVAPKGSFRDDLEYHDPAPVVLVGEVTSASTAHRDRGRKLRIYARAGIPCYLLVDREAGQVFLHTEPSGSRYTRQLAVEISKKIALPEPLGFTLDTAEF